MMVVKNTNIILVGKEVINLKIIIEENKNESFGKRKLFFKKIRIIVEEIKINSVRKLKRLVQKIKIVQEKPKMLK